MRIQCHPLLVTARVVRCRAIRFYRAHPRIFHVAHGSGHAIYFLHAFAHGTGFVAYLCGALAIAAISSLAISE